MNDHISERELEDGVPAEYRHFFKVSSVPLPLSMLSIAQAFWRATAAIGPVMWFSHPVHVIFAADPFRLNLSQGELRFTMTNSEAINVHVENLVFLDCNKMDRLSHEIQVACILEELVHACMHITDEDLVSVVVAHLYPGVELVDGKYSPVVQTA